jgi:peptidyl-prolyl cis-trans isomerase D
MAVIGRIRRYSGLLLVFVGLALAAFVMGDLFQNRVRTPEQLAEINGERISAKEFGDRVDEQVRLQELSNPNASLTSTQRFQTMESTWNMAMNDILIRQECEKIGLAIASERHEVPGIHPDELRDQIQGDQPHPYIVQNFTDPATGQLNRQNLNGFLGNLEQLKDSDPNTYAQWLNLESLLAQDRLRQKYSKMIEKAFFTPDTLAKVKYIEQNRTARFRILGLRSTLVPDSVLKVDDTVLKEYYEKYKHRYEQEASREIKYVQFSVTPSEKDIRQVEKDIADLRARVLSEENSVELISASSDVPYDSTFIKKGELSPSIDSLMFSQAPGFVSDIYYENNSYRFARLVDIQSRPDSIRFSHIFIAFQGAGGAVAPRSKEQAQVLADSLYNVVKRDAAQFEPLASQYSDDTESKPKGGDLDWLRDPGPVNKLINAVVAGQVGTLSLVEGDAGYHVVKITGKTPLNKKVRVAILARNLSPSEATFNQTFSKASDFAASADNLDNFLAIGNELNPRTAMVKEMDMQVATLEDSRNIIRWAYEQDRKVGDVSDVIELNGIYIVATVSKINEKGITPFEDKKADLEPLVKNELRVEYLVKQLEAELKAGNDIYSIAAKLNGQVDTNDFVTFSSTTIPGYGPEAEVIGTVFSSKPGEVSAPIKGRGGAFIVIVDEFVEPQPTADYSMAARIAESTFAQSAQGTLAIVLKDAADIEDNRGLYY